MDERFSLTSEVRDNCVVTTTSGFLSNIGRGAIAGEFTCHPEKGKMNIIFNLAGG